MKKEIKKLIKPKRKEKDSGGKAYYLTMKMNDSIFQTYTDNLYEAILSFKPKMLKTKILFTIIRTSDNASCERQVFALKGRNLFRNKMFLETFIRLLCFKTTNG